MNPTAPQLQQWRAEARAGKRILVQIADEAWDYHQMGLPGGEGAKGRSITESYESGGLLFIRTDACPDDCTPDGEWDWWISAPPNGGRVYEGVLRPAVAEPEGDGL